jgi:molybdenum cofactor biosynthesis enzyme MoaA
MVLLNFSHPLTFEPLEHVAAMVGGERSPVPDLLFEDVCAARIAEIQPFLDRPEAIDGTAPLHRLTVFLTYACNLTCPYCKTIARSAAEYEERPQKRAVIRLPDFAALLDRLAPHHLRHVHFTGGEAALRADLPQMIQLAKARGVAYASITSNGTLPPACYRALVDAGIDEIRISLDASDPALGAELSGRPGAWSAALASIAAIVAARDRGAAVFLVLNMVVGRQNRARLSEIVRFLLEQRPDDIKLITEVQQRGCLGDFETASSELVEIERMLAAYPPERFALLRRKLQTVFAPEAIGLEQLEPGAPQPWRCYIPLTERTVDGVAYYPCSVYLREGGAPLGALTDTLEKQRERTAAFVRAHDCRADPICRQYCLHCTRQFNEAANRARRG